MSFVLKKSTLEDIHHGGDRQHPDGKSESFYIVNKDFGFKYDFLSPEDKKIYDEKVNSAIDWKKYKKELEQQDKDFSENWKSFLTPHDQVFKKYKVWTIGIMLLKHFIEGRSTSWASILETEKEAFFADMRSIGIDTSEVE